MFSFKKGLLLTLIITVFLAAILSVAFLFSFNSKYNKAIIKISKQYQVDAALVLGIAKAESKFNPNAKSKANAVGIMQIKLESANYVRELYGETGIKQSDLYVPEINIDCGVRYLKYLFSKFNDIELVICAYNAGETNVRAWLNDENYSNDGKKLNKIPFAETEIYLKKVKFNQKIYKFLL